MYDLQIEIKKLSPDLLDDYLRFFETEAHADNPGEDRCYCVCWCSADHRIETDFSSPEKRRVLAVEYVKSGALRGYLAYSEGKAVGWCNANEKSKCTNCTSWLRFMAPVEAVKDPQGAKIKSVFCFAVAPVMKRKGVASRLLERACADAAEEGYDFIEAYPSMNVADENLNHTGSLELYKHSGFEIIREARGKYKGVYDISKYVVRKNLKRK